MCFRLSFCKIWVTVSWLKGDSPDLFDANYVRKEVYKYFCDGIAGRNLAEDFK